MADRDLALRAAEKLLRVGKLDAALAQYHEVLAKHPDDHATVIVVAGLLYRAGRLDEAMRQFTAAADALAATGEAERASDVYKRILSARPGDEHALVQAARLAVERGAASEARDYFLQLADVRTARDNRVGALEALGQAIDIDAAPDLVERLFTQCIEWGEFDRARGYASGSVQRRRLARAFEAAGREDDAFELLQEMLAQDAGDVASAAQLARMYVERGDAAAAARYLSPEMAGDTADARLATAEILCRGGRYAEGLELIQRTVSENPGCTEAAGEVAGVIAAHAPGQGWSVIRLVVDLLCAQSRWAEAASALETFIAQVPDCTDAIVHLVEVAVDGHLTDTAERAQARLANVYLVNGASREAAAILEDLASRHPEQPVYVTQLRQALVMAGEADPDAVLKERLTAAALVSGSRAPRAGVELAQDRAPSSVVPFRAVV